MPVAQEIPFDSLAKIADLYLMRPTRDELKQKMQDLHEDNQEFEDDNPWLPVVEKFINLKLAIQSSLAEKDKMNWQKHSVMIETEPSVNNIFYGLYPGGNGQHDRDKVTTGLKELKHDAQHTSCDKKIARAFCAFALAVAGFVAIFFSGLILGPGAMIAGGVAAAIIAPVSYKALRHTLFKPPFENERMALVNSVRDHANSTDEERRGKGVKY